MRVRVLTCDECPNTAATESLVRAVLEELGVRAQLDFVQILDEKDATEYRFLGSPTVQVDGADIEAERRADAPSFTCRLYSHKGRRSGVPPKDMVVRAILEARQSR